MLDLGFYLNLATIYPLGSGRFFSIAHNKELFCANTINQALLKSELYWATAGFVRWQFQQ